MTVRPRSDAEAKSRKHGVITRRRFLQASAGTAASLSAGLLPTPAAARTERATLVIAVLRGGADGMSMLIPHADPRYHRARPSTRLESGRSDASGANAAGAIDLDGFFGVHPKLPTFATWYERGELAAWPAVGWKRLERTHARAERRLRACVVHSVDPARVVWMSEGEQGRAGPAFSAQLEHAARLIERATPPAVIWTECSGWDTHVAQSPRLADNLTGLDATVSAARARFARGSGRVSLLLVTEFGRSPLENAHNGTDDGHAAAWFLIGSHLDDRGVRGDWPGLTGPEALTPTSDAAHLLPQLIEAHASHVPVQPSAPEPRGKE